MLLFRKFKARLYYYLGHYISIPMAKWDLGFLYPVYNKLMIMSSDLDYENALWQAVDENKKRTKNQ